VDGTVGFAVEDARVAGEKHGFESRRFGENASPKRILPPSPNMENKPRYSLGSIIPQEERQQLAVMENAGNQLH
jgi:hypothetical protein